MPILRSAWLYFASIDGVEDQVRIGRAIEPAVGLDLVLELSRRTSRHSRAPAPRSPALRRGDGAQDVDRRGQADAVVDRQRRLVDDRSPANAARSRGSVSTGPPISTCIRSTCCGRRMRSASGMMSSWTRRSGKFRSDAGLVDDDAHRAFRRMGAEIDDGAAKRSSAMPGMATRLARRDSCGCRRAG